MDTIKYRLLLADDDTDDCIFFEEALRDLPLSADLTVVNDGAELMGLLHKMHKLPDILFLDLNMPRKTGYECLSEIKHDKRFRLLPVVIFSTSFDPNLVNLLYEVGAHYYIRKPAEFSKLRQSIHNAIGLIWLAGQQQPVRGDFVLNNI